MQIPGKVAVSVIIPVYNAENYIVNALKTAKVQTLKNIEIICVDDGSTDHSAEIIREYMKNDSRIVYLYQENSGPGTARNLGLQYATGEYIAFLDSDDEYPKADALEVLYTKAKGNDAYVCGGSVCGEGWINEENAVFPTEGFRRFIDYQNDFMFWRFIYQRKFLEDRKLKFPNYRIYEDPVFLVAVLDRAESFYAITEFVYKKNKGHLSKERKTLTDIKQRLAGTETNIRLSIDKKYNAIYQRSIIALCNITACITELIINQDADNELYEQLITIVSLISIRYIPAAERMRLSSKIRILLRNILGLSIRKKQVNQSMYLGYRYLKISFIYYWLRIMKYINTVWRKQARK